MTSIKGHGLQIMIGDKPVQGVVGKSLEIEAAPMEQQVEYPTIGKSWDAQCELKAEEGQPDLLAKVRAELMEKVKEQVIVIERNIGRSPRKAKKEYKKLLAGKVDARHANRRLKRYMNRRFVAYMSKVDMKPVFNGRKEIVSWDCTMTHSKRLYNQRCIIPELGFK